MPERVIAFSAADSLVYRNGVRTIGLWGNASIRSDSLSLQAPRIDLDLATERLQAFDAVPSTIGANPPVRLRDQHGSMAAVRMEYDLRNGTGRATGLSGVAAAGKQPLVVSGAAVHRDEEGSIHLRDGTLTTCDEAEPHYWISSPELTYDASGRVTAKPLYMYVRPEFCSLRLPVVPVMALPSLSYVPGSLRSSGFLFPGLTSIAGSTALSGLGYYWVLGNAADLKLTGDLAFSGSWRVSERFRYVSDRELRGEIAAGYTRFAPGSTAGVADEWNLDLKHNQQFGALWRFDADLHLLSGDRGGNTGSSAQAPILTEQADTRISLVGTTPDEMGATSVAFRRSGDLRAGAERQELMVDFFRNRVGYEPERVGPEARQAEESGSPWRHLESTVGGSVAVSRLADADGRHQAHRLELFAEAAYRTSFSEQVEVRLSQGAGLYSTRAYPSLLDAPYSSAGFRLPLRIQTTLFRSLQVNPSVTMLYFKDVDGQRRNVMTTLVGVDAGTRLYGTLDTGFLQWLSGPSAIRHTFVPILSYRWNAPFIDQFTPAQSERAYDWRYSALYRQQPWVAEPDGQSTVTLTLSNLFHGSFRQVSESSDGTTETFRPQLLTLNASMARNNSARALHYSPLTLWATSSLLSSNLLLSAASMHDLYDFDPQSGERVDRFNRDAQKPALRFVKGFVNMSLLLHGGQEHTAAPLAEPLPVTDVGAPLFAEAAAAWDWQVRCSLFLQTDRSNPLVPVHDRQLHLSVRAAIGKSWQAGVNTGWDLERQTSVYPVMQLYRDMHCWQMGVQWVASGPFRGYAFQLGLKPL